MSGKAEGQAIHTDSQSAVMARPDLILDEAEIAKLRQKLGSAYASGAGRFSLKGVLPRRTRLRLWLTHQVNGAAIWLVEHGHERMAVSLWRVFRLWR